MNTLEKSQALQTAIDALTPYIKNLRETQSDAQAYAAFHLLLDAQTSSAKERDADMLRRHREAQCPGCGNQWAVRERVEGSTYCKSCLAADEYFDI